MFTYEGSYIENVDEWICANLRPIGGASSCSCGYVYLGWCKKIDVCFSREAWDTRVLAANVTSLNLEPWEKSFETGTCHFYLTSFLTSFENRNSTNVKNRHKMERDKTFENRFDSDENAPKVFRISSNFLPIVSMNKKKIPTFDRNINILTKFFHHRILQSHALALKKYRFPERHRKIPSSINPKIFYSWITGISYS